MRPSTRRYSGLLTNALDLDKFEGILRGRPVLVLRPEVEVETEYSNAISAYEAEDTLIRKIGSLFTDSNSMSGLNFCHTIMTGAGAPFWQPNPPACGVIFINNEYAR